MIGSTSTFQRGIAAATIVVVVASGCANTQRTAPPSADITSVPASTVALVQPDNSEFLPLSDVLSLSRVIVTGRLGTVEKTVQVDQESAPEQIAPLTLDEVLLAPSSSTDGVEYPQRGDAIYIADRSNSDSRFAGTSLNHPVDEIVVIGLQLSPAYSLGQLPTPWVTTFTATISASSLSFDGRAGDRYNANFKSVQNGDPLDALVALSQQLQTADDGGEVGSLAMELRDLEQPADGPSKDELWLACDPSSRELNLSSVPLSALGDYVAIGLDVTVISKKEGAVGYLLVRSRDGISLLATLRAGQWTAPVLMVPGEQLSLEYLSAAEPTAQAVASAVEVGSVSGEPGAIHVVRLTVDGGTARLVDGGNRPPSESELSSAASQGIRSDGSIDVDSISRARNG